MEFCLMENELLLEGWGLPVLTQPRLATDIRSLRQLPVKRSVASSLSSYSNRLSVSILRIMEANSTWAFALYDFKAMEDGDLAFRAGDLLQLSKSHQENKGQNWLAATNPRTRCVGEVPANYITSERGYSAALDAFRETDRNGASKLLQSNDYSSNFNYVIRPSRECNEMALSIKPLRGNLTHYKIYFSGTDPNCFLFVNKTFKTIEDLVIYYMENEIAPGCILQAYKPFKDSLPTNPQVAR
ncbi:Tyrosine-protein kinase Src42A [Echinococcus granulosus]|nr:Tyrosine-protein kinase Src42A [Echinococcus granulosus]